jgi:hypothetical protein
VSDLVTVVVCELVVQLQLFVVQHRASFLLGIESSDSGTKV